MNLKKAKEAIQQTAVKNGVSIAEVRNEMKKAIKIGLTNKDSKVQARWKAIPHRGEEPTPEELITYLAKECKAKRPLPPLEIDDWYN